MKNKTLVFTDLDGTLLDHYNYQTGAAEETIAALKLNDIPIIPNSSKTLQEIMLIREQLQLQSPFIIENGAAVYIPVNYFALQPQGTHLDNGFWVKPFCQKSDYWLSLLSKHATQFIEQYQGFSQLTNQQLAALTGLTIEQATLAKMRQYGEPINWLGSAKSKAEFINHITALGVNILQGGRFLHISGHCDKGQAQAWLAEQYQKQSPEKSVVSIALGDSDNDSAMLEQANIAIQIKSPVHGFPNLKRKQQVYQSHHYGPIGWAECLHQVLLDQLIEH